MLSIYDFHLKVVLINYFEGLTGCICLLYSNEGSKPLLEKWLETMVLIEILKYIGCFDWMLVDQLQVCYCWMSRTTHHLVITKTENNPLKAYHGHALAWGQSFAWRYLWESAFSSLALWLISKLLTRLPLYKWMAENHSLLEY